MKEINLSFKLSIVLNQTDIHFVVEEKLLKMREEVFLEVLEKVISGIEREALKKQTKCDICGIALLKNGHEERKIKTLVGEITINRARLRCPICKTNIYPFDDIIGLGKREHFTLGIRERSLLSSN